MARNRNIIIAVISVAIAATLFIPFAGAIADNTGTQAAVNDEFEATLGENVSLANSNIDSGSETVEWNDSGTWTTLSDSEYTMYYESGEIKVDSGTTVVTNGTEMRASYDYEATDSQTTTVLTLAPLLLAVLLLVVLANRIMAGMEG